MTQSEKDNHLHTFHKFQQAREKHYAPLFNKAIRSQIAQAVTQLRNGSSYPHITSTPIYEVLRPLYKDVATVYAHKVLVNLKREQKARMPFGFSDRMLTLIQQYYGIDFLNMSEDITNTTKDYIAKVLEESYPLGLGIDDIIARLQDSELSRQRARVIARTETVGAANAGGLVIAKDTGLDLVKVWVAAKDKRTRRDHVIADEKKVGIDDYFTVGGYKMLVPGDRGGKNGQPKVPAKEIVQCRCSAVFEKRLRA